MKISFLLIASMLLLANIGFSKRMKNFNINMLPLGKELTLLNPATTHVPIGSRVTLASTDVPQSLKLTPIKKGGGKAKPIRIALMEVDSKKIRYIDIKPGVPFVYSFRGLSKISIVPDSLIKKNKGLMLEVESDRPLEISR